MLLFSALSSDLREPATNWIASYFDCVCLFSSTVSFIGYGCALVDDAENRHSLSIRNACDRYSSRRCADCGYWIGMKARGRAFTCPLEGW